jgi:hypothetical protein
MRKIAPNPALANPTTGDTFTTATRKTAAESMTLPSSAFLCNEWIFGEEKWNDYCQVHLDNLQTFLIYLDPLVYGGVLAIAGYCPFCLTDPDPRLPAAVRMHQFPNRAK